MHLGLHKKVHNPSSALGHDLSCFAQVRFVPKTRYCRNHISLKIRFPRFSAVR